MVIVLNKVLLKHHGRFVSRGYLSVWVAEAPGGAELAPSALTRSGSGPVHAERAGM